MALSIGRPCPAAPRCTLPPMTDRPSGEQHRLRLADVDRARRRRNRRGGRPDRRLHVSGRLGRVVLVAGRLLPRRVRRGRRAGASQPEQGRRRPGAGSQRRRRRGDAHGPAGAVRAHPGVRRPRHRDDRRRRSSSRATAASCGSSPGSCSCWSAASGSRCGSWRWPAAAGRAPAGDPGSRRGPAPRRPASPSSTARSTTTGRCPRGSSTPGEDDREAAVREVEEETGHAGAIERDLGTIGYDVDGGAEDRAVLPDGRRRRRPAAGAGCRRGALGRDRRGRGDGHVRPRPRSPRARSPPCSDLGEPPGAECPADRGLTPWAFVQRGGAISHFARSRVSVRCRTPQSAPISRLRTRGAASSFLSAPPRAAE